MPELSTIYDYMRLCGAPHKRIYVKMLFMLSCFMKQLHLPAQSGLIAT